MDIAVAVAVAFTITVTAAVGDSILKKATRVSQPGIVDENVDPVDEFTIVLVIIVVDGFVA